jgi:hypothetical protein
MILVPEPLFLIITKHMITKAVSSNKFVGVVGEAGRGFSVILAW